MSDILIGYFWDPLAVWICEEGGEGATLDLRIGGKCGVTSGDPVDLRVTVKRILQEARQSFGSAGAAMGTAVWVQGENGLDIVLNNARCQVLNPDGFEQFGIDPGAKRGIVVKSMQHFYAGFAPIATQVIYVNCPGAIPPDTAGASANLTLTPGTAGTSYAEFWLVWNDYDGNGDFGDAGELFFSGSGTAAVTGSFVEPASVSGGATRMRVAMQYEAFADTCQAFQYGEVEDYTVQF